jgi:hypothetical protein
MPVLSASFGAKVGLFFWNPVFEHLLCDIIIDLYFL